MARAPLTSSRLFCPYCRSGFQLRPGFDGTETCPACHRSYEATHFRPVNPTPTVEEVARAGPEGATPCNLHEANAATVACERCGLFVCTLCEIEASADGKVLCPFCFERLRQGGNLRSPVTRFPDHVGLTLTVGLLGFLVGGILFPIGLFLAARGLSHRTRMGEAGGRLWLHAGIALALGQALFLLLLLVGAIYG